MYTHNIQVLLSAFVKLINVHPQLKPQITELIQTQTTTIDAELQQRAVEWVMCCNVLQCVAVCCIILQCVANHKTYQTTDNSDCLRVAATRCRINCLLQCMAVCCHCVAAMHSQVSRAMQSDVVCCNVLQCVAECCSNALSIKSCDAMCCSVLQCALAMCCQVICVSLSMFLCLGV